jgi:threonine dehydratase
MHRPAQDHWGQRVLDAYTRIRSSVLQTPVEEIPELVPDQSVRLLFKMENLQETGSFKLRGATNKILSLTPQQAYDGVIAASNGNHGLGVAAAARRTGIRAEVYVSSHAAQQSGKVFISPYNDLDVMAGQGTIAVELLQQVPQLDALFVAVGGGGLIGGIGAYLKSASPQTEVVGCWPENSPVLYESIRAGRILDVPEQPTVSESTTGGLEQDSVTLAVCKDVIDRSVLVTEEEILSAMRRVRDLKGWLMEGAAGVALAAFLKHASEYRGKTVAVIICGGNLSKEVLNQL